MQEEWENGIQHKIKRLQQMPQLGLVPGKQAMEALL